MRLVVVRALLGRAILDETKGIRPGTVAQSAQNVVTPLNEELEDRAFHSGLTGWGDQYLNSKNPFVVGFNPRAELTDAMLQPGGAGATGPVKTGGMLNPIASLRPARDLVQSEAENALRENAQGLYQGLRPMDQFLRYRGQHDSMDR